MKKLITICGMLVIAGSFSVYGQAVSPAKRQDIIKLIEVMDAKAQMVQSFDLIFTNLMVSMGDGVSPDVKRAFKSKFESRINDFVNVLIPVYDKYYTHDDIKQIIKFYETPTGKRMIKSVPLVTQESFTVGQKWGQELAQDVVSELMKLKK
ncbi:MAG: DUF2059 domain-containing protein [Chitinispirillales bacterium]|jgi:hypothetical protein|nr:DUF2059 domain-containing protein [Chitinispirillales bacterium]